MPKEVKYHRDSSMHQFADDIRALTEWTRRLNRTYRALNLGDFLTQEKQLQVDIPEALSEIATAGDKIADNLEKNLDGQIDEWGSESNAPPRIREEIDKLRVAIRYMPVLNSGFRFADEKQEIPPSKRKPRPAKSPAKKAARRV